MELKQDSRVMCYTKPYETITAPQVRHHNSKQYKTIPVAQVRHLDSKQYKTIPVSQVRHHDSKQYLCCKVQTPVTLILCLQHCFLFPLQISIAVISAVPLHKVTLH